MYDFTNDAHLLLRTVEAMNCSVGITRVVLCLRGSKTSHIYDATKDAELHGKGKHKSEEWWKSLSK
jgi:superfamily II DNA helicase RecQ